MAHDSEFFRRRAADARCASSQKADSEGVEVAGQLALAYAALARRRAAPAWVDARDAVDAVAASAADSTPMMLKD